MKQKFIFVLFLSYLSLSLCFSQTHYLNVNLRDGTRARYVVGDIQKIDFSGITNIDDAKKIDHFIKSFKLHQNYPNPFNPSTTIEYNIPKSGYVEVAIYDLRGRLVKTLVKEKQIKGNHKVVWYGVNKYGKKVVSGFYIYSIKFENSISSKKMILIK